MKALLISDRPEIIDFVTPLLKDNGFDLIHYRWIIKALDNIEEIQPDIIVLSAAEYPRHWKTLAGFVQSGIGGNDVRMYLYDTEPLSDEDTKKAEDLGILSFEDEFQKIENVEDFSADVVEIEPLVETEPVNEAVAVAVVEEPEIETEEVRESVEADDQITEDVIDYINVELALNDACGKMKFFNAQYNPEKQVIQFDYENAAFENGPVKYVSMFDGSKISSFSADLTKDESHNACLFIKEYYEKEI